MLGGFSGWSSPTPTVRTLVRRIVLGSDMPAGSSQTPEFDVPQTGRHLRIYFYNCRTDSASHNLYLTANFNADTTAANYQNAIFFAVTGWSGAQQANTGAAYFGRVSGTADAASIGGTGMVIVSNYTDLGFARTWLSDAVYANSTTQITGLFTYGFWTNTTSPILSMHFGLSGGNFVSGSFDIFVER